MSSAEYNEDTMQIDVVCEIRIFNAHTYNRFLLGSTEYLSNCEENNLIDRPDRLGRFYFVAEIKKIENV